MLSLLYIVWYDEGNSIHSPKHSTFVADKTMPNLKLPQSVSINSANMTSVKCDKTQNSFLVNFVVTGSRSSTVHDSHLH